MQLSPIQVAKLLDVHPAPLIRTLSAVLAGRADDPTYTMTQADADAIAAHLDEQASAPLDEEFYAAIGESLAEARYQRGLEVNEACGVAKKLFGLSGLHTPEAWLD